MHSTGVIDPQTGLATKVPAPGWTSTFSDALITYAAKRRDIVAITAAMPGPDRADRVREAVPGPVVRRRHRRAARDDVGRRPGDGRPAPGGGDLLDLPQPGVRPDHDGRRTAQAAGDHWCWTGPASPVPTVPATTACGTCRCWASCRACGWPRRATPPGCARNSARRSTSTTGRPPCGSRKVMSARTFRRSSGATASTCSPSRPRACPTTCCWWRSGRSRRWRWRSPSGCATRASA